MTAIIRFEGVSRRFGDTVAVDDVSLDIVEGEFFTLLGPSGCGKTTLLRMLAGFEVPDAGRILIDGTDVSRTAPSRRPVNMVFQSYAIFPHLSVAGNVGYGLKIAGVGKAETRRRVAEALALVKLPDLGDRRPDQLSGGQRQRVALARALVNRPRVLLLDEPLSALDAKLRDAMQSELATLQRTVGITFVMVTHDQDEALALSDRCAVMERGRLRQVGSAADLYDRPTTRFVADFLGNSNLFAALVDPMKQVAAAPSLGVTKMEYGVSYPYDGGRKWLSLRPEHVQLFPDLSHVPAGFASCAATVVNTAYLGASSLVTLMLADGAELRSRAPGGTRLVPGTTLVAAWDPAAAALVDE